MLHTEIHTASEEHIMPSKEEMALLQQQFLELAIEVLVKREASLEFAKHWISPHLEHDLSGKQEHQAKFKIYKVSQV